MHRLPCLGRFAHGQRHCERSQAVLSRGRRCAFTTHCGIEPLHRALIEILVNDWNLFLFAVAAQGHRPDRLLRHHRASVDRSFCAMDLQAGIGVSRDKRIVDLGQSAACESHHAHHGIFQSRLRHALRRGHRHDRLDLVAEHKAQRVRIMHRDVENDAATRLRAIYPPPLEMARQINRMEDPCRLHRADGAAGDKLFHLPMRASVPQMMVRPQYDTSLGTRCHHFSGILERESQRLFTKNVLPGGSGGQRLRFVPLVRRADVNDVDVRVSQQLIHRPVSLQDSEIFSKARRPFWIGAGSRGKLAVGLGGNRRRHPFPADRPRPNDPPTQHGPLLA